MTNMAKELPKPFRWLMRRHCLKRSVCDCANMLSLSTCAKNHERSRYAHLFLNGLWNGREEYLPHYLGCPCLDDKNPGQCTCGIRDLAEGRTGQFLKVRLRQRLVKLQATVRDCLDILFARGRWQRDIEIGVSRWSLLVRLRQERKAYSLTFFRHPIGPVIQHRIADLETKESCGS